MIKKWYKIQLIISFVLGIVAINTISLLNGVTANESSKLFLLSLVFAVLFTILNAVINYLNFTYKKRKNIFLAFHLPAILWVLFFAYELFKTSSTTDIVLTLLFTQPILYNLLLKHKATQNN